MKVHFLNVGHGDCTIIEHDSGNLTMIDINNGSDIDEKSAAEIADETESSYDNTMLPLAKAFNMKRTSILAEAGYEVELTNPVEFLAANYPNKAIFRYVQSHPDLDHMRGLTSLEAFGVSIVNFWDTEHAKIPNMSSDSDEEDWSTYQTLQAGSWNGDSVKTLKLYRGSTGQYYNAGVDGNEGGDGIQVLSPTPRIIEAANKNENYNNLSYVLLLNCRGIKIILGGDAEQAVWDDIHSTYGDKLKCHVLKASHHGRDSGYHQKAVEAMRPQYAIVSVGKKPRTDASNKYRQYSDHVWSTRWKGNITLTIDSFGKATIDSEYDR